MREEDRGAQGPAKVLSQAVEGLTDVADYLRLDPVPPVLRELRSYSLTKLKADALAGLMIAIVTLPQAVAFALIVGLPMEAVIASALVGSVVYSLWTKSRFLVFGPTNTLCLILASAIAATGAVPLNPLQKAVMIGFMIGVVQLASGLFKLGNLTRYISRTVIVAYATAAAILIAAGQLSNLMGLGRPEDVSLPGVAEHVIMSLARLDVGWVSLGVGGVSIGAMLLLRRWKSGWPDGLVVLGLMGGVCALYETLGPRFGLPPQLSLQALDLKLVRDIGEVSAGLPVFQGFPLEPVIIFIPQVSSIALAAAMLGMLEVSSVAGTLSTGDGHKLNSNQEFTAAGLGNILCSAFGAMAGSASFVRSNVARASGAATQLAPILGSLFIGVLVFAGSSLVGTIPIPTLAAYIVMLAFRLVDRCEARVVRRATGSDALVYWVTLSSTLFLKLDTAIYVGMGLSLALFLRKAASPSLVEYGFNAEGQLSRVGEGADRDRGAISIVHVEGDLFFGAADLFQEEVRMLASDEKVRAVILRLKNARHLDATSVLALLQLRDYLASTGRHLLISGISRDTHRVLSNSGAIELLGPENLFPAEANLTMSTRNALRRANQLVRSADTPRPALRVAYSRTRARELEETLESEKNRDPNFEI